MNSAAVAIRVDSSAQMGSGHLMRCLTLADELQRRGACVCFVSREHQGHLIARLDSAGHEVYRLPMPAVDSSVPGKHSTWLGVTQAQDAEETLAALNGEHFDWLVVDHYGIDADWQRPLRTAADRIMVIDDLADRAHDADLVLDQNYLGADSAQRYDRWVPERCRRLMGPRYALLQPIYRQLRQSLVARDGSVRRLLVFFGARDTTQATLRVLAALDRPEFVNIAVDVVPGSNPQIVTEVQLLARARRGVTVYEDLPSLAELILRADLAVGAGGATTWERACLGVPALVATIADNQVPSAKALAADGFIALVGPSATTTSEMWCLALREIVADPQRIAALGRRAQELTDGHGASRIAMAMLGARTVPIRVRQAQAADEALLLEWANDPTVRYFAFNKDRIAAEQHHRWFNARLHDPNTLILIGEDNAGLPVGQVRFDAAPKQHEATIDVSVDPGLRGTGIGVNLLQAALGVWRTRVPNFTGIAEVVVGNEASQHLFLAAGFTATTPRRSGSMAFELRP